MLFLASNPIVEASVRFRIMQFLQPLERAGHLPVLSTFFPRDRGLYGFDLARGVAARARDLATSRHVDRLLIHREFMPLALNDFARLLPRGVPMVYDFDDAVFMPIDPGWRRHIARRATTRLLVERADLVYAGNAYLAEYASRWSRNVRIVPTVVDTDVFRPCATRPPRERLRVGWVGSPSTAIYLPKVMQVLDDIGRDIPFDLRLIGADRKFGLRHVNVECLPWRLEEEVGAFQDLDIGLYPLEDDLWSRGKCGFKAIQYMACGVPFIASPVGVVQDIVREGVDGLWARSDGQWRDALEALLRDATLRARVAQAARTRVVERYSLQSLAPSWIGGLEAPWNGGAARPGEGAR